MHDCCGELLLEPPHRRGGEHLAEKQQRQPTAPFAQHRRKRCLEVRRIQRCDAAGFLHVLGGLFIDDMDDVVDGHHSLHAARVVHDGHGEKPMIAKELADDLLIRVIRDGDRARLHHVTNRLRRPGTKTACVPARRRAVAVRRPIHIRKGLADLRSTPCLRK